MIGGVICPPQEADASTAPAKRPEKPDFFINGIVKAPVVTVLAMGEPEIMPKKPEETTETFADPPDARPAIMVARSMNSCPSPLIWARMPKRTKWKT